MKIFIAGMPGCGKTTLIKYLIKELELKNISFLAIISEEIKDNGKRKGFNLSLIDNGKLVKKKFLALKEKNIEMTEKAIEKKENRNKSIKFGKYFVFINNIDKIVDEARKRMDKQVVFIDEIGKMEYFSNKFKKFISDLIKSNKIVIATLHRTFVSKFKSYGKVYWLNRKNFNRIFSEISHFFWNINAK